MTEKRINKIFAFQIALCALFLILSIDFPNDDGFEAGLDLALGIIFFGIFYIPVMAINFIYNIIYCIVLKKKASLTPIAVIVLSFIIKILTIGFTIYFTIFYAMIFIWRSFLMTLIFIAIFLAVIILSIISMTFETKIRKNEMKSLWLFVKWLTPWNDFWKNHEMQSKIALWSSKFKICRKNYILITERKAFTTIMQKLVFAFHDKLVCHFMTDYRHFMKQQFHFIKKQKNPENEKFSGFLIIAI